MHRIDSQKLVHSPKCFQKPELDRRQERHRFVHLAKVEAFAWDLELFAQLQLQLNERVVLKGGAAAQLYFPVNLQRNSVDIDIVTDVPTADFEEQLQRISARLCPDGKLCRFTPYVPRQPREGLRVTKYTVEVPSACTPDTIQLISVDVLFGKLPPAQQINVGTPTFALDLAFPLRVITADALFGDKLLTLAATTVGIPEDRANDRCKQLYDLYRIVNLNLLSNSAEIQSSFAECMEVQHQIAGQQDISLENAVLDVVAFLQKARLMDFDDPLRLFRALESFQSNFVGVEARLKREQWVIGIETIRLMVQGLIAQHGGSPVDPVAILERARSLERLIDGGLFEESDPDSKARHVGKMLAALRRFCEANQIPIIRGRSPQRVFWYLVTPESLSDLEALLYELVTDSSPKLSILETNQESLSNGK